MLKIMNTAGDASVTLIDGGVVGSPTVDIDVRTLFDNVQVAGDTMTGNLEVPSITINSDNISPFNFKNILINGNMQINQRNFNGSWGTLATDAFGYDRWKKYGNSSIYILQQIEEGNYKPNTDYTLSGTGIITTTETSPNAGNWSVGHGSFNLSIQNTSTNIQLEEGTVATPFEQRPIGLELSLCQRYFWRGRAVGNGLAYKYGIAVAQYMEGNQIAFPVDMRLEPTIAIDIAGTYGNCTHNSLITSGSIRGFTHRVDVILADKYRVYDCIYTASAEL